MYGIAFAIIILCILFSVFGESRGSRINANVNGRIFIGGHPSEKHGFMSNDPGQAFYVTNEKFQVKDRVFKLSN